MPASVRCPVETQFDFVGQVQSPRAVAKERHRTQSQSTKPQSYRHRQQASRSGIWGIGNLGHEMHDVRRRVTADAGLLVALYFPFKFWVPRSTSLMRN